MQNEERINGLETQVRTLKRIVYGFGCLLVAGVVVSATSVQGLGTVSGTVVRARCKVFLLLFIGH